VKTHLTDLVQRLQTAGTWYDEGLPGFGIRVDKNRKTWIVMRGQIRQRVRIGHYPAMSLADARKEPKKLLIEKPTRNPAITYKRRTTSTSRKSSVGRSRRPTIFSSSRRGTART